MRLGQLRSFVVYSERPFWVVSGRHIDLMQATIEYSRNRGHAYPIFVNFDICIYDFRHFSIMLTILSRGRGSRHHYDT